MNTFFDLNNQVALKFQEIQYGFISGVEKLLENRKNEDSEYTDWGLNKLWKLKQSYEQQLVDFHKDGQQVKDINVCFRCFDKEKPCTDCD